MAVVPILQYPDPRLKIKAKPVDKVDDNIRAIVASMFATHYNQRNCAALAASQLDWGQTVDNPAYRITVIDFSEEKNSPLCLINPVIRNPKGETNSQEGCMSVQNVSAKVRRAERITVDYLDEAGNAQTLDADGFLAKCIQHEVDHLDGVLFIDRLSKIKQMLLKRKFKG